MTRLIGLYREREYSPGRHQSNDARLLEEASARLRERGFAVELTTIDRLAEPPIDAAMVFSMCQGRAALERLCDWESRGVRVVNSPRAALNTYRDRLPSLLERAGVPYPATRLIPTDAPPDPAVDVDGGLWLKRGGVHASVASDVQWIDSLARLEAGRVDFAGRGIQVAALQAHRAGDEIKFYGLAHGRFFHWFYPGESRGYAFDAAALTALAVRAASAAGLDIFGGDVIVSPAGDLTLIDLNDWPSFAPCREAASDAIAEYLAREVHAAWNPGLVSSADPRPV